MSLVMAEACISVISFRLIAFHFISVDACSSTVLSTSTVVVEAKRFSGLSDRYGWTVTTLSSLSKYASGGDTFQARQNHKDEAEIAPSLPCNE